MCECHIQGASAIKGGLQITNLLVFDNCLKIANLMSKIEILGVAHAQNCYRKGTVPAD